ncbi:MAG: hypothetical protein ABFD08_18315 [Syntrophomonas sp.]
MAAFLKILSFTLWFLIMMAVINACQSKPQKRKTSREKSPVRNFMEIERRRDLFFFELLRDRSIYISILKKAKMMSNNVI